MKAALIISIAILPVVSCGSSVVSNGMDPQKDASTAGPDGKPADVPPSPKFGLDKRPTNVFCKAPPLPSQMSAVLSQTGCFDKDNPKHPGPALIPFDVASPLWSDGAEKHRFFALPEGQKIHIKNCETDPGACRTKSEGGTPQDEGHLDFPVGSVLVKTFGVGTKLHETRLLIRFRDDLWTGFSYKWRDDQTDADLEPDDIAAHTAEVNDANGKTITWSYPSRAQCLQCHTEAAGVSLGPELRQLNFSIPYENGVSANQVETLDHIGVFDATLPNLPEALVRPTKNTASVEARARSYLHANCAICHRPFSNFAEFDLRFTTPLEKAGVCNTAPSKGELGVAGAKRLVPEKPEQSLLSLRMHSLDMTRMPQIGTGVVDQDGVGLIENWIREIHVCP